MMEMEDIQSVILRSSTVRTSDQADHTIVCISSTMDALRGKAAILQEVVMRRKSTAQQRNGFKQVTLGDLHSVSKVEEMSTLGEVS